MLLLAVSQAVGVEARGWGAAIGLAAVVWYLWARTRTFVALNDVGYLPAAGFVLVSFLLTSALVMALGFAIVT